MDSKTIILGGGCFWCTEAIFQKVKGVLNVESGYSGGESKNPTYKEVCSGESGHAEVIKIEYDPETIRLEDIFRIFFNTHNPTTLNKQGADEGTQYRSVIFYGNPEEKEIAEKIIQEQTPNWKDPIVTELSPLKNYYKAEGYHQNYYNDNPGNSYCFYVIKPKIEKFLKSQK